MKIREIMNDNVCLARPNQTIQEVAKMMQDIDAGSIPIAENDRLVGMVTDRDIAIRGVAKGLSPDAQVREVMSPKVKYCFDDEEIESVADNMHDIRLRRLPVLNREKRLVGIVSLGDISARNENAAGYAMHGITEHGAQAAQQASA